MPKEKVDIALRVCSLNQPVHHIQIPDAFTNGRKQRNMDAETFWLFGAIPPQAKMNGRL
jgi:hypothetical protein